LPGGIKKINSSDWRVTACRIFVIETKTLSPVKKFTSLKASLFVFLSITVQAQNLEIIGKENPDDFRGLSVNQIFRLGKPI
jgi:hypothetical protein